jgi:integrase
MFVMAKRWGVPSADVSPMQRLSLASMGHERGPVLTAHDVVRLRKAAQASQNPHLGFIVSLLLLTKLRVRELLTARWEDVDLENGLWRVASASSGAALGIPLTAAAIEIVRQLPRWDDCPHVIANPRTRTPYRSIYRSWDAARKRAAIVDVSIHDLRHCAS